MANILISGGTGFLGSALTQYLLQQGHLVTILRRNNFAQVINQHKYEIIINLAGEPIFFKKWSLTQKQLLRNSRINLTKQLVEAIADMPVKPKLLINASAIGYYGNQENSILTENSASIPDFLQQLCADWENTANEAEALSVRVCIIRTGLVLAKNGGFLKRMLLPFRYGLGGQLGSGQQWMSWIHLSDWLNIVQLMINDTHMHGAYNATAPNPVTNKQFTQILAHCLKRPAYFNIPVWVLNFLLGEMSHMLTDSQRVIPERLLAHGFKFNYTNLPQALDKELLN